MDFGLKIFQERSSGHSIFDNLIAEICSFHFNAANSFSRTAKQRLISLRPSPLKTAKA